MRPVRPLVSIVLASAAAASAASTCKVASPAHRVALVELYTSQGCSSCPPADRWLSALPQRYRSQEAIPLAMHVGYWDYIGWKDPYAKPEFNARQREWAAANGSRSVYTPGVFVQGREVRDWSQAQAIARQVSQSNATPAGARIELDGRVEDRQLRVAVSAETVTVARGAELRVALVQSGLSTAVAAGENRGEKLGNDHVVREWSAPMPLGRHQLSYALPPTSGAQQWAVVAIVQTPDRQILQALRWSPQACQG